MTKNNRKVVIIGAGIAGLCAAVYARRCGYDVELLEQHESAGGFATSWRRKEYTFETCLHRLLGSNPRGTLHAQCKEVFDIERLNFVDPEEFVRLETEHGQSLSVYSNVDRLEAEFLSVAPQDAEEIRHLAATVRRLSDFQMPDPSESWPHKFVTAVHALPKLPLLRQLSSISSEGYGQRFKHPLLKSFFGEGEMARLSALALIFSLAWMSQKNAGYPIGGSQAVIRLILEKLNELGGNVRFGATVEKILVQADTAAGVQLVGGEIIEEDWVISAADGHATIYKLLDGKYVDKITERNLGTLETFPSYLQVSMGVARDFSQHPGFVTRLLDISLEVDPNTRLRQLSFRFFHFDPTFAPLGKTAVTCFLPTRNFAF